ncbi:hypothetical protein Cme02nite_69430 [Catellatospora methionotrophica]|uniref:Uncharacterized protein n=1 Tax=Catellatospora methionotrophica TaxID=121620 RepID=A0A8J3PKM3_9ACTN|nr:hypothetical protein [Catellatospora methionotrophica]GIG18611.1 hypothetical protein Cme02nite_69430 [Catellatospora methionotrophica]
MANKVTLTFAGDADSLAKEAKRGEQSLAGVGTSATSASADFAKAAAESTDLATRMGRLGSAVTGTTDAIDSVGASLTAVNDIQQYSTLRSARLARALNDVSQAQEDYNQALLDGKQAQVDSGQYTIDAEQAALDASVALKDYAAAVKEHGKNSDEAKQAQLDLKQAQQDAKQATVDQEQATRDATQSVIDAEAAQLDLADAQREANPTGLSEWAEKLQLITPILSALVGIVGLVTAAQWLWNIAMSANPIGLIIIAVGALIAIIVLIATKTTIFQDAWRVSWGWIKKTAVDVWNWLKELPAKIGSAFMKVAEFIGRPFRAAFNFVADAWNNTIGKLQWSVPDWVPVIGGNTIGAPRLPKFHSGGVVPGTPGQEVMTLLQAGERVTPSTSGGNVGRLEVASDGTQFGDALVEVMLRTLRGRGIVLVRAGSRA